MGDNIWILKNGGNVQEIQLIETEDGNKGRKKKGPQGRNNAGSCVQGKNPKYLKRCSERAILFFHLVYSVLDHIPKFAFLFQSLTFQVKS